jgi:hypothetical protein
MFSYRFELNFRCKGTPPAATGRRLFITEMLRDEIRRKPRSMQIKSHEPAKNLCNQKYTFIFALLFTDQFSFDVIS